MADLREIALQNLRGVLEKKDDILFVEEHFQEEDNAFVMMLTMTALRKLVYVKSILKTLVTKKLSKQKRGFLEKFFKNFVIFMVYSD